MNKVISRLAPSPTGELHLGNAWSFVMCWLLTRSLGGEVILRIDDLDPERSKEHYIKNIISDLHWLGLNWEKGPDKENGDLYYQSNRLGLYQEALEHLKKKNRVYPCFCSRKELRMLASAPHSSEAVHQPCPCRDMPAEVINRKLNAKKHFSQKLRFSNSNIIIRDLIFGDVEYSQEDNVGDFALQRSDGVFAYQLASAVDDALMGVNLVVRGNDLLDSSPKQLEILQALDYKAPIYAHLPLILDHEGERLAKRHAGLSLNSLRKQGISASQIIGLFAWWAKFQPSPAPLPLSKALEHFSLKNLPVYNIILPESIPFSVWRG